LASIWSWTTYHKAHLLLSLADFLASCPFLIICPLPLSGFLLGALNQSPIAINLLIPPSSSAFYFLLLSSAFIPVNLQLPRLYSMPSLFYSLAIFSSITSVSLIAFFPVTAHRQQSTPSSFLASHPLRLQLHMSSPASLLFLLSGSLHWSQLPHFELS
jgi:hypothetical protein